jgi:L-ribulokinase
MQIYADVLGRPMLVAGSAQTPALGSAVAAAVTAGEAAGGYAGFEMAQQKMTRLAARRFDPDPAAARAYDTLYAIYRELHDSFGGVQAARADFPSLMKRLLAFRGQVSSAGQA